MANDNVNLNTKVSEIDWGGRALAALKSGGLMDKPLSTLAEMTDDELLSVERLGRVSLKEIRQKVPQSAARAREAQIAGETTSASAQVPQAAPASAAPVQTRQRNGDEQAVNFARSHPSLINAIISGEMILVPKL